MSARRERSVRERVRRARAALLGAAAARALLVGGAAALALLAALAVLDLVVPLDARARVAGRVTAAALGLAAAAAALWRARRAASLPAVALWLEERVPQLDYALVTALELDEARGAPLERRSARVETRGVVRRAALRALRVPALVLLVLGIALAALPAGTRARVAAPRAGDSVARAGRRAGDRLSPIVARVAAPRYAGGATRALDEPTTIAALAGSVVTIEGRGGAGVSATLADRAVTVTADGDRWRARFDVPARAAILRLRDGDRERLVAVDARADAPPTVTLETPARDTVLRVPAGRIPLAAEASDDIGVALARFEVIVSSGEGESFTFRSTSLGAVRGRGARVRLAASLRLDSLGLKPGDIVHLRAVARDANDVTGPGVGSSETRTLRVARAGEYDSVAVEAAPPAAEEKSALSQRMLIVMTEALERRRPRLARATLLDEASRISADQTRLRRAVGDIIFMRLSGDPQSEHAHGAEEGAHDAEAELLERARAATEHTGEPLDFAEGESPVVAVNRPLLEAYNAMWDAGRELDQGAPARALPHMRRALAAIQRARQAERIYLRGRPPAAVVDLAKVRLSGRDRGDPAARTPLPALSPAAAARADRLARALALVARGRAAEATDSLLVLRVDALGDPATGPGRGAPALARALDELVDALRRGRDATAAALRARRAAAGEPAVRESLDAWGGGAP